MHRSALFLHSFLLFSSVSSFIPSFSSIPAEVLSILRSFFTFSSVFLYLSILLILVFFLCVLFPSFVHSFILVVLHFLLSFFFCCPIFSFISYFLSSPISGFLDAFCSHYICLFYFFLFLLKASHRTFLRHLA